MELKTLTASERDSIIQFSDATQALTILRLINKPSAPITRLQKKKIWESFKVDSAKPIADSSQALIALTKSNNPELKDLVERATQVDARAMEDLRKIGRKLKL